MDFDHLTEHLRVADDSTAEYVVDGILGVDGKPPVLITACTASEYNRGIFNELARDNSHQPVVDDTIEDLQRNRVRDAKLCAKHAIRGWRNVPNKHGKEVPFSPEAAEAFLLSLAKNAGWRFDRYRVFARNPANFAKEQRPFDAEAVAKNS